MGLLRNSGIVLLFWGFSLLCFKANCYGSEVSVKFLKVPRALSHQNSAAFVFQALLGGNEGACTNCSFSCKLDNGVTSLCGRRKVYLKLQDGRHNFQVCTNGLQGVGCTSYDWIIDTVPPTAFITASKSFTNALNFSVTISFSEPCIGGGGFSCLSVNACNLLVYGSGQVIPASLNVLQQYLKYSLNVGLSSNVEYGRVILVMDKDFCTDGAGNRFIRTENSSAYVHFDRRNVLVDLKIHIPEKILQLNGQTRTVQATNNYSDLNVYLYFTVPVLNTSAEVLRTLNVSEGILVPITSGKNVKNRKFGFLIANISRISIVTVSLNSNSIIGRQGTPVSPILPVTFLYDSERPSVKLSTTSNMRTKEHNVPISIKFRKPVFDFNSSYVSVSGGHLQRFQEIDKSTYMVEIKAIGDMISINVPENITQDVAGNKNLASNVLRVKHYSMPMVSSVISAFVTASFAVTSLAAGILTFSTASIQTLWAYRRQLLTTDPAKNLFV